MFPVDALNCMTKARDMIFLADKYVTQATKNITLPTPSIMSHNAATLQHSIFSVGRVAFCVKAYYADLSCVTLSSPRRVSEVMG